MALRQILHDRRRRKRISSAFYMPTYGSGNVSETPPEEMANLGAECHGGAVILA